MYFRTDRDYTYSLAEDIPDKIYIKSTDILRFIKELKDVNVRGFNSLVCEVIRISDGKILLLPFELLVPIEYEEKQIEFEF